MTTPNDDVFNAKVEGKELSPDGERYPFLIGTRVRITDRWDHPFAGRVGVVVACYAPNTGRDVGFTEADGVDHFINVSIDELEPAPEAETSVYVIEQGSQAWDYLESVVFGNEADEVVKRKLSLNVRRDGIAFKVNEFMWTPTLKITKD